MVTCSDIWGVVELVSLYYKPVEILFGTVFYSPVFVSRRFEGP